LAVLKKISTLARGGRGHKALYSGCLTPGGIGGRLAREISLKNPALQNDECGVQYLLKQWPLLLLDRWPV
jgi:hypothetical protein